MGNTQRALKYGMAIVQMDRDENGEERPTVVAVTRDADALIRALDTFLQEEEFLEDYLRETNDAPLLRECEERTAAFLAMRAMAIVTKADLAMERADAAMRRLSGVAAE
jgi:hypothetical protein